MTAAATLTTKPAFTTAIEVRMKTTLIALLVAGFFASSAFARDDRNGGYQPYGSSQSSYDSGRSSSSYNTSSPSSHEVQGYTRSNGTYVAPHHATNPDNTTSNNWSHQGNVNPYTGRAGTKRD